MRGREHALAGDGRERTTRQLPVTRAAAQELSVVAWSGSETGRIFGFDLQPVDLGQPEQVRSAFQAARPGVIIHAAALASVAACRDDPERARAVNAQGSALLARLAAETGTRFVHVSTDMVFDGERGGYREQDSPSPLSVYGRSKSLAEESVISFPNSLVVRISLLFGPSISGRRSYFDEQVDALRQGRPMRFFPDEWRTPLGLLTAARALLAIARSECVGYLHLGPAAQVTAQAKAQVNAQVIFSRTSIPSEMTRKSFCQDAQVIWQDAQVILP